MSLRFPLAPGEWYHCFTRGIDKRATFIEPRDYERFLQQLYLCNTKQSVHRSNLGNKSLKDIFNIQRPNTLAAIGAFCLMPNHFHLFLQETTENGISTFMQKLGTAYTMYFNIKYERNGALFTGPFRSKHISDDRYFQKVIGYIHCNPAELYEPLWKEGVVDNVHALKQKLLMYPYSSIGPFSNSRHVFRSLLDQLVFEVETQPEISEMLEDAREYYEDIHQGEALMYRD